MHMHALYGLVITSAMQTHLQDMMGVLEAQQVPGKRVPAPRPHESAAGVSKKLLSDCQWHSPSLQSTRYPEIIQVVIGRRYN